MSRRRGGRRHAAAALAVVLVVAAVAPAATTGTTVQSGPNATATPAPGARLAGAAAVGAVETEATVAAAAFEARLSAAATDAERADAVVAYLAAANRSLDELERDAARVARGRADGSMDAGERAARRAAVAAGARAALAVANRSETAAAPLPAALRRGRAIPRRIAAVRRRAGALLSGGGGAAGGGVAGGEANATAAPDPDRAAPITLDDVVAAYEAGTGGAPGELRGLAGTEQVEVVVRRADGRTVHYALRTRGGEVVAASRGRAGNATLRVYTTHGVVRQVRAAEDPWPVVRRALADGRLAYDGVGPANTLKFGAVAIVQGVADALGGS